MTFIDLTASGLSDTDLRRPPSAFKSQGSTVTTADSIPTPRIDSIHEKALSKREVRELSSKQLKEMSVQEIESLIGRLSRQQLFSLAPQQIQKLSDEAVQQLSIKTARGLISIARKDANKQQTLKVAVYNAQLMLEKAKETEDSVAITSARKTLEEAKNALKIFLGKDEIDKEIEETEEIERTGNTSFESSILTTLYEEIELIAELRRDRAKSHYWLGKPAYSLYLAARLTRRKFARIASYKKSVGYGGEVKGFSKKRTQNNLGKKKGFKIAKVFGGIVGALTVVPLIRDVPVYFKRKKDLALRAKKAIEEANTILSTQPVERQRTSRKDMQFVAEGWVSRNRDRDFLNAIRSSSNALISFQKRSLREKLFPPKTAEQKKYKNYVKILEGAIQTWKGYSAAKSKTPAVAPTSV